jgi:hypothetical protein
MMRRAFAALAVMLAASAAGAAGTRWSATAVPPQPNLPVVEVIAGYDGPYVPRHNVPIELHARAGAQPFDGYIGFAFGVAEIYSADVPAAARAVMTAHGSWSFSTTARLVRAPAYDRAATFHRSVFIEWRNRDYELIAKRNVGDPPWSDVQTLRITGAAGLRSDAQWFDGFADIVTPVSIWLDLPRPVREAILHCGSQVNFIGTPRAGQRTDAIDDALLPVRFELGGGAVAIPPIYHPAAATIVAPVSWRATAGAVAIGSDVRPYVVVGGRSAYLADEAALRERIPAVNAAAVVLFSRRVSFDQTGWPRDALRAAKPLLLLLGSIVLGALLWMRIRRNGDVRLLVISLLAATAVIYGRRALRPPQDMHVHEQRDVGALTTGRTVTFRSWGNNPVATPRMTAEEAATWVGLTGYVNDDKLEVRSAGTLPGHGVFIARRPWDSVAGFRYRVDAGRNVQVRVITANSDSMTFEYQLPMAPQRAVVTWTHGGVQYAGGVRLDRSAGRATARAGALAPEFWRLGSLQVPLTFREDAESAKIIFQAGDRAADYSIRWEGSAGPRRDFRDWRMLSPSFPIAGETAECLFRIPNQPLPKHGSVTVSLTSRVPLRTVELIGDTASVKLTSSRGEEWGRQFFSAAADDVAPIIGPTRMLRLRFALPGSSAAESPIAVTLYVRKTEP